MGIFRQFPYSNFHEMNLDEIIKIMRELQDEWIATKAEWASYKDFIDNYFANLDVTQEVLSAMRVLAGDGTLNHIIDPVIVTETASWLEAHITSTSGITVIDDSLSVEGAAADAKATGDAIKNVEDKVYPAFNFQYLKKSTTIDNSFWYRDSQGHVGYLSSNDMIRYAPVRLEQGIRYTLTHIYAEFSMIADGANNVLSSVKDLMNHFPDEHFNNDCSISFIPDQICFIYVTRNKTKASGETMLLDGDYIPTVYVEGGYPKKTDGMTAISQLIDQTKNITDNSFWYKDSNNNIGYLTGNDYSRFNPILLKAGVPYTFTHVYAQFTFISDLEGHVLRDFNITDTPENVNHQGTYTPTEDCLLYLTRYKIHAASNPNLVYSGDITKATETLSASKGFTGIYGKTARFFKESKDIHVAKDGSGDYTSIVTAMQAVNATGGKGTINVYIHHGEYDVLDELGGASFLATVEDNTSERQGLGIWRDNVNLIGVGNVILKCELPDNATYNQSARVSTLNMGQYDANIENLIIIGKNCRYAVHDECNGWTRFTRRKVKNVKCIHRGNASGLWQYPHVWGGGAGGGCVYDFINCSFTTESHNTAWSYHISNELEPCFFNVDGCVGICNNASGKSFRFSYLGSGNNGTNTCHVKCCSGNGSVIVEAENASSTNNNIEVFNNGWETIS